MSDDKPDVQLEPEVQQALLQLTTMFLQAVDEVGSTETRDLKVMVIMIPTDTAAPMSADNVQLAKIQLVSTMDHNDVPPLLKKVTESMEAALKKGVTKTSTVFFGSPAGGLPN